MHPRLLALRLATGSAPRNGMCMAMAVYQSQEQARSSILEGGCQVEEVFLRKLHPHGDGDSLSLARSPAALRGVKGRHELCICCTTQLCLLLLIASP